MFNTPQLCLETIYKNKCPLLESGGGGGEGGFLRERGRSLNFHQKGNAHSNKYGKIFALPKACAS